MPDAPKSRPLSPAPPRAEDAADARHRKEETAIEETMREKLGLARRDLAALFDDTATAATDVDLPYWTILVLSGCIALLGVVLNASAVVIGAMLIAPLLAPLMGLAMALAVGDGRLAAQTLAAVVLSVVAVVAAAALVTAVLPFKVITPEISARTRPTTLDLGIAVFSGLAGAVVTASREDRLSAAIPGVAISVALIPPLSVTGFALGAGLQWELVWGSLLLVGANLGGIVLSAMGVFFLVGMHRPGVVAAASVWHEEAELRGLPGWIGRQRFIRRVGVMESAWARVALVLAFVVAVGFPLSTTLQEITRETRVNRAVEQATARFDVPGRSSVLGVQPVIDRGGIRVHVRVATEEWFGEEAREAFEREAAETAGEPVSLHLEQVIAADGAIEDLADILPGRPARAAPAAQTTALPDLLAPVQARVGESVGGLTLPRGVTVVGTDLVLREGGRRTLRVGYAAERPLPPEAEEIVRSQLSAVAADSLLEVVFVPIPTGTLPLSAPVADSPRLRDAARYLRRYGRLRAALTGPAAAVDSARAQLTGLGVAADRIDTEGGGDLRLRLFPAE